MSFDITSVSLFACSLSSLHLGYIINHTFDFVNQ